MMGSRRKEEKSKGNGGRILKKGSKKNPKIATRLTNLVSDNFVNIIEVETVSY